MPRYPRAYDVAIHLCRMAQEAIDKAVRHGKARHIWIRLGEQNGIGVMSVVDDGAGLSTPAPAHRGMGLRIMKHRAEMIGGILQVRKGHHLGTIVMPEQPANLTWGDGDYGTLYITATTSVYRLRTKVRGFVPYLQAANQGP